MPVTQLLDQPHGPLHLTLPERPGGLLSWYECGIVAKTSHYGFCSALVLSTQVTLLGGHALDVVEGFVVRMLRFIVEMPDGFWSASKSVIASASATLWFTEAEEGSFVSASLAVVIGSVDGIVFRPALRSSHHSRSVLGPLCRQRRHHDQVPPWRSCGCRSGRQLSVAKPTPSGRAAVRRRR